MNPTSSRSRSNLILLLRRCVGNNALLIIDFFYDRYFVIISVPSFEFILVFIGSFSIVFEKLFPHSNHLSFLVKNVVHQPIRVFCSHPMKVNLDKR